ncbi:MAG: trypsin-like peptidase domain-containing protein [Patescibacteria group bacterium]
MSLYDLPEFDTLKIKKIIFKNKLLLGGVLSVIIFLTIGFNAGIFSLSYFSEQIKSFLQGMEINIPVINIPVINKTQTIESGNIYTPQISYEQAIINTVKEATPSVVSIIITKNLPVYEQKWVNPFGDLGIPGFEIPQYVQKGTKQQEVGGGSGFIVSEDGLILTNKHVVLDKKAEYTVFTNDGQKFSAKVLALNPVQDLAIIKVESNKKFKAIKLGDSSEIQIGQSAIAIGNALGEFRNTVSVGVISGLGRTISASGQRGFSETLEDIIQTDAAINAGNSGGPLLNLKGEVIGINTAMAQGAEAIGFAIPINRAKRDIEQVSQGNKIVYPFLGVRYVLINEEIKDKNDLSVDYGAWVIRGSQGESAITKGSAAEIAGIKEKDIILEFNNEKIITENSMAKIISKYNAGDKIILKILRNKEEIMVEVILGERPE